MASRLSTQAAEPDPNYDPAAIFDPDGPIHPGFMREAVRTLMRSLPLDPDEPSALSVRRMHAAMLSLAALHPRDEVEVMLGVQALSAYHMASANWWLAMNHHLPNGDSGRHASVAASAARTYDTLLKALERRQARPLAPPPGRPPSRVWPAEDPAAIVADWTERCREETGDVAAQVAWTAIDIAVADALRAARQAEVGRAEAGRAEVGWAEAGEAEIDRAAGQALAGLAPPDDAEIEGVQPDGSIIMPEDPTPQQARYIARRLGTYYRQAYREDRRRGVTKPPAIRPIRPGDRIP